MERPRKGMTPAARARAYARSQKWIKANPQKRRAHRAVEKAKKAGDLTPEPCIVCQAEPAEAHHPDYNAPLRIEWLCPKHHKAAHAVTKNRGDADADMDFSASHAVESRGPNSPQPAE